MHYINCCLRLKSRPILLKLWLVANVWRKKCGAAILTTKFGHWVFHVGWKSPKMSHLNCSILAFSTNFCPFKIDLSGNTVWPKTSWFEKMQNWPFWAFWAFLTCFCPLKTQNLARFARNHEWDFFYDFQTLCVCVMLCTNCETGVILIPSLFFAHTPSM